MAQPAALLNILVRANTASANLGLAKVNAQARMTAGRFGDLDKSTEKTSRNMRNFARVGAGALVGGLVGFTVVAKKSVEAAVDLGEEINKTKVVFRGSEQSILKWSKTTAYSLGISRREALESAGVFGNMLVPMGFARDRAGEMSVRMVKLAADMASFNNASPKETLDALRAGLAGESEPLRRYGVFLNDARLKQEALNLHLKNAVGANGALTTNAKALATYSLILKDSKDAQGDFHRTSSSLANQQRILKAEFEDVSAKLGTALIPALTTAMKWLTRFVHQMETGKGAGGDFARVLRFIGRAINEVVVSFVHFGKWIVNAIHNIDRFRDGFRQVTLAIQHWFVDAFNTIKRTFGNVMAFILRRMADLFDLAAKLPFIGGKFKDLADKARGAANRVDQLGENIRDLPAQKKMKLQVSLALNDLALGNVPPLRDLSGGPGGGPPSTRQLMDGVEAGGKKRTREWVMNHLDQIAPLLGAPGNAPGTLGLWEQIGHRMGLVTTSGYRPGDPGFHGQNRARDLSGSAGAMLQYARFMYTRFGTAINELIHTPLGVGIDNHIAGPLASLYPASTLADHYDHVHVALAKGGTATRKVRALVGEEGPEIVDLPVGAQVHSFSQSKRMVAAMGGMLPGFASGGLVARAAYRAGFRGSNLLRAVAEARGESGWNERAVGDGGWSKGLMQIYTLVHTWARKLNLFDPFVNMRAAMRIFRSQGWGAWHADHRPHISAARAAVAAFMRSRHPHHAAHHAAPHGTAGHDGNTTPWSNWAGTNLDPFNKYLPRWLRRKLRHAARVKLGAWIDSSPFAMERALAELTPSLADDTSVARRAVSTWAMALVNAQRLGMSPARITTAATELKSARDWLSELTGSASSDTAGPSDSAGLLRQLLDEANQRTAVSQAQYGVFKDFAGMFAAGGRIPAGMWGIAGDRGPEVVHGPATVRSAGDSAVALQPHIEITFASGMEWLEQFVDARVVTNQRATVSKARRRPQGRG